MSVNSEEKIYNDLMNEVPSQTVSGDTKQSAAALAGAESTATGQADNYKSTYSGKLDDAISNYLTGRGFEYDPMQDKAYQQYRKEFAQNAAMARNTSRNTANQLAGGYNPTYADTVADEVYNDRMGNISDAESTFKGLAQQDYQAKQEKNANVLNLYNTLEGTDYSRNRDKTGDYKNYLNLLASRYSTDRQADTNLDSAKNDIYSALEDYLLENCTVDMPADYRSDVIEAIRANFIDRYCSGDESQMETVLSSYGYTEESIEQEWSDSVESSIKLELIVKAIAEKEDIQIDDTEFEDYVSTIVSNGGYGDADTLYSNYGYGDSVYGKNQIRVIYLAGLVLDKLAETAEVTENAVEENTESVESTESADSTEE